MDKLVKKVDLLWETKSVYREQRPEKELQEREREQEIIPVAKK